MNYSRHYQNIEITLLYKTSIIPFADKGFAWWVSMMQIWKLLWARNLHRSQIRKRHRSLPAANSGCHRSPFLRLLQNTATRNSDFLEQLSLGLYELFPWIIISTYRYSGRGIQQTSHFKSRLNQRLLTAAAETFRVQVDGPGFWLPEQRDWFLIHLVLSIKWVLKLEKLYNYLEGGLEWADIVLNSLNALFYPPIQL